MNVFDYCYSVLRTDRLEQFGRNPLAFSHTCYKIKWTIWIGNQKEGQQLEKNTVKEFFLPVSAVLYNKEWQLLIWTSLGEVSAEGNLSSQWLSSNLLQPVWKKRKRSIILTRFESNSHQRKIPFDGWIQWCPLKRRCELEHMVVCALIVRGRTKLVSQSRCTPTRCKNDFPEGRTRWNLVALHSELLRPS